MLKPKLNTCKLIFIWGLVLPLFFITSFVFAETKTLWLQDPRAILSEFKKDYKIEKDAEGWYWFLGKNYKAIEEISEDEVSKIPAIQMLEKTKEGAKFRSFATYASITPTEARGENFTVLRLPGGGAGGEVGKPEIPYYGQFIAVPKGVDVALVVESIKVEPIQGEYKVFPVQPPLPDTEDAAVPEFTIDEETYKQDEYIGEDKPVRIASDVIVRGRRLIYVIYQPVLYNPSQNKLKAAWKVDWSLKYNYSEDACSQTKDKTWEKELSDSIGNMVIDATAESESGYQGSESLQPGQGYKIDAGLNGADYLIIVHDNFYNQILPLAEWKEKKGYKVQITKLTEIKGSGSPTADEITNYITTAYKNWNPAPLYLLLVGDSQFLPVNYKTRKSDGSFTTSSIATDLYYVAIDGTDIFPDFFVGRLPCATTDECKNIVDKILLMEKNPPAVASFYTNALIAGYFQDDNKDGIEDRLFLETCEGIKDFLQTIGWNISTSYVAGSTKTPRKYNSTSILHNSKATYVNTQVYLTSANATAAITNTVNSGVCLVQHRDHGGETLWGDPRYTNTNVQSLTNKNIPPWLNSINCLTGRFDYSSGDCFAEAWLKKIEGGAYAVIAATRVSYSWWNDYLSHGFYECIWPNYMETLYTFTGYKPGTAYPGNVIGNGSHLGQVLNFGKIFMFDKYASGNQQGTNKTEFEIFHLLGCPEQEPRLVLPQTLTVNYPTALAASALVDFDVVVTAGAQPVKEARVCLLLEPTEFYVGITDEQGKVHFEFTPTSSGDMQITVTHKDALPFEGTILIDATAPTGTIKINNDASYTGSTSVTLNLSAQDTGSGVAQMQFSNDNTNWSAPEAYATTKSWALTSEAGTKTVYVKFRDVVGNWSSAYSDTIILDTTAPQGSIKINNDATNVYTNTATSATAVTLNLSASDTGSGMGAGSQMQFSNDKSVWSTPEAYATSKSWTLPSGVGTKTVYVKFRDVVGNWSSVYSDTIILDNPPTTVSVSPNSGTLKTNTYYTFKTVYSDLDGQADLKKMHLLINPSLRTEYAFYVYYDRTQNKLYIYNFFLHGFVGGGYAPGSSKTIEGPFGKLYCSATTVSGSGNDLTIKWRVSFKSSLAGTAKKNVYLQASDTSGVGTGWQQKGTITIK